MHRTALRRWLFTLLICLPATAATAALAPLADRVPSSAVAYVGFAGTDALQPTYAASHLKAVLDDTNFVQVFEQQWPRIQQALDSGNLATDPAAARSLWLALRHPMCLFADAVDVPGKAKPVARVGLLIDAGDDDIELVKALQNAKAPGQQQVQIGSLNHIVWFVGGAATPFVPEHGGTTSLGESERFTAAQKRLDFTTTPAVSMYVDVQKCLTLAGQAAEQDEQGKKYWPGVRDALGLTNVQAVAGEVGFNGPDWAMEAFVSAPSPRTGLLAVVEPKPIDPKLLARVPADADDVSATNFDAAALFDTVKSAIGVDPETTDGFGKVVGAANLFVGRNIRRQLLAPLGPQWVATFTSSDPKKVELFNLVNDPKTLQDALTTATYTISNTLNMKLPAKADGSPGAVASQDKISGITITSIALAMASPAWAIHDSVLAVTADPGVTLHAFDGGEGGGAKAVDSIKSMLNVKNELGAFIYADLPHSAPVMYDRLATAGAALLKLKGDFQLDLPDLHFPTLDQLKAQLSPAASAEWADDQGWTLRSISPFPGSSVLSASGGGGAFTSGATAMGTGILLPSISRSRELADRVKSASNERQIGLAILLYATDHQGKFPEHLGELVTENLDPGTFISPKNKIAVPTDLDTDAKKIDWINTHSDYVYVGKGLTSSATPATVVLYEDQNPDASEAHGVNVLYGDGHVAFVDATTANQIRQSHPAP